MSDEKKKKAMETTTLTKVPMEERKSWISVAFMQAGIMITEKEKSCAEAPCHPPL